MPGISSPSNNIAWLDKITGLPTASSRSAMISTLRVSVQDKTGRCHGATPHLETKIPALALLHKQIAAGGAAHVTASETEIQDNTPVEVASAQP
ncbi:MAG: hypothetical protein RIB61_19725 [Roseicyclus sp.]